ncbi:hypothetical protein LINGRAHAP2_LOCUS19727, partial [Linum grandiflorum]
MEILKNLQNIHLLIVHMKELLRLQPQKKLGVLIKLLMYNKKLLNPMLIQIAIQAVFQIFLNLLSTFFIDIHLLKSLGILKP